MTREEAREAIKEAYGNSEYTDEIIKALEQEPTTKNDLALIHTEGLDEEIRCTMCTNSMKSDRGCDGSCVVNSAMYKNVMDAIEKRIQPTTKNDLAVDCISRADALEKAYMLDLETGYDYEKVEEMLKALPTVTPIRPKGHWTDDGYCSCCNNQTLPLDVSGYASGYDSFCPNCGADMREVEE